MLNGIFGLPKPTLNEFPSMVSEPAAVSRCKGTVTMPLLQLRSMVSAQAGPTAVNRTKPKTAAMRFMLLPLSLRLHIRGRDLVLVTIAEMGADIIDHVGDLLVA